MVYYARCLTPWGTPMGAIKIGCSYGHELRLKAITSTQPYDLELLAAVPGEMVMEALVHLYLSKHRIRGEFFHDNAFVRRYIDLVAARGTAFYWMDAAPMGDSLPDEAFQAFLAYHGLTIEEVCEFLGRDPKLVARQKGGLTSRKIIAGAILMARGDLNRDGRMVQWPLDAIRGLLGLRHPSLAPIEDQREAA